ncbi:DNA-binding protein Alba [Candidatus Bathyarchaeota archaeon]|nr:DNA-binding protein Alba [Candidatus Bathyarchaeota archaeon]
MSNENIIYVGRKPVMNYVLAVMNCFNQRGLDEVILRARGRAISTAVDTAEVTRNRFLSDLTCSVSIGTEQLPREEGGTRNVSTMEITLTKSPTGEVEKEESAVPAGKPEPAPTGEPDEPATVEEPAPEESPEAAKEEEKR